MPAASTTLLQTLCRLRWVAIAGQAIVVLVATRGMQIPLEQPPWWAAIALLASFNLYASWHARRRPTDAPGPAFSHLLVDIAVLAWLIGCSGGISNPFSSLFLVLIAIAALALPLRWVLATTLACLLGYLLATVFGRPLPHIHGNAFDLHLWGMAVSFVLSTAVVLYFSTHLVGTLRRRERELALLRERFARNEGIVALATHAAAVAHELNTPLATMTLLADDIAEQTRTPGIRDDADTLRQLIDLCRDRVRALAASADMGLHARADLEQEIERWQLIRPTIDLKRQGQLPAGLQVEPAVGHLLQALLNNAADASQAHGATAVELELAWHDGRLRGSVRDHGAGFDTELPLPADSLFRSSKPEGLGVGLALSHATVERLGGSLQLQAMGDGGTRVDFELPLPAPTAGAKP